MAEEPTVLVIDDDPDVLDALRIVLEANGFDAVTAQSAEEGRRAYDEAAPDVLIVDLMMEEVDAGATFVRDLCALDNAAPIFLLSSVGDSLHGMVDYSSLGLAGVFQKPIDPQALIATLRAKLAESS